MSYIRKTTRPQGDRPIKHAQKNFGQGLNLDLPATDINTNANPNLENYVAYERYVEGRSGSVLAFDNLPGTGTIHSIEIHSGSGISVMHRGPGVYIVGAVNEEILELTKVENFPGRTFELDQDSKLVELGKEFLLYTGDEIYKILISFANKSFFRINGISPSGVPTSFIASTGGPFKYKYVYTFAVLVKNTGLMIDSPFENRLDSFTTVVHETPPVIPSIDGQPSYFTLLSFDEPIGVGPGFTSSTLKTSGENPIPEYISTVAYYRSPDLGQNGLDNLNFDQYAYVGEGIFVLPEDGQITDLTTDEIVNNRLTYNQNLRMQNIGWEPLPVAGLGEVSPGFIFASDPNSKSLYYSQRVPDDTRTGFYDPGFQFHEFDDEITVIARAPDVLSVICTRKSFVMTLTSIINSGVNQTVNVINHIDNIDEDIGVTDVGSFVKAEDGSYIAICSDKSVRAWDAGGWSRDLSLDRIGKIIERIKVGVTVGGFYKGAYYIWFTLDDSAVTPDDCLRFAFKRSSGNGWTFISGNDWIFPHPKAGVMVGQNFAALGDLKQDYFFVISEDDDNVYWIEPFDGPANLEINGFPVLRYYADKISSGSPNGTDIACRIREREVTGSSESFNIKHSESHAFLRDTVNLALPSNITPPPSGPVTYPELFVDALAFVDGSQVSVETAGKVDSGGDIQFWYRVEGSRIAIEYQTNRSGHRLVEINSRFRVQDINRPNSGPTITVARSFQEDFQTELKHWWFSRPLPMLDRTLGTKFPLGLTPVQIGPDLRSNAVLIGVGSETQNKFIKPNRTVYTGPFSISFWIGSLVFNSGDVVIVRFYNSSDVVDFTLVATSLTEMTILEGVGNITVDDLNVGGINGYHQITLVRTSGNEIRWYQNTELKGTTTFTGSFGGGKFEAGAPAPP